MRFRFAKSMVLLGLTIGCGIVPLLYNMYITAYNRKMSNHDQRTSRANISRSLVGVIRRRTTDQQHERLTPAEVGQRFERRLQHLKEACLKYRNSSMFRPLSKKTDGSNPGLHVDPYWPVMNVSVDYCPIEKTGSTTWRRLFGSLYKAMNSRGIKQTKNASNAKNVKFLFVRDPYYRLLSAYTDKLFCPNTIYWNLGKYIVKKFRPNPTEHSLACGHDVTFPEFIRYIIHSQETGQARDGHFVPTHDHCALCNASYDYIGHLETLSEDVPYLLNAIQSPVSLPANFDSHTLYDNAGWVLKKMTQGVKNCMSMKEACLRLWKKWHVRGIISKTESLPVTAEEAEVISDTNFVNRSLQALARSGPKWERRQQETEALREAFATVPMEDRLRLQKLLTLDFELFGFDPAPVTVFPAGGSTEYYVSDYRYFDLKND
ncbi:uncharacterized protein LOC143282440 isoform X2 [Babylonia areolata]